MPDTASESTAAWFSRAARELGPHSARHGEWAAAIADDPEVLAVIERLPPGERHPSLVFAVADLLGAPAREYAGLREWMLTHAETLAVAARGRRTQTNEVGRTAPLAAALARIEGPVVLLELGAAAGLCLALDRWTIRFERDGGEAGGADARDGAHAAPVAEAVSELGAGDPLVRCAVSGPGALPTRLPRILARRGVDLAPLDSADPADARWLEALTPVDRPDRRARLRAALVAVRSHPIEVVEGDAAQLIADPTRLRELSPAVPAGAELVIVSLGTLVYLRREVRAGFLDAVRSIGARSITLEGAAALPEVAERLAGREAAHPLGSVLALDGEPLARTSPHGDQLRWIG